MRTLWGRQPGQLIVRAVLCPDKGNRLTSLIFYRLRYKENQDSVH